MATTKKKGTPSTKVPEERASAKKSTSSSTAAKSNDDDEKSVRAGCPKSCYEPWELDILKEAGIDPEEDIEKTETYLCENADKVEQRKAKYEKAYKGTQSGEKQDKREKNPASKSAKGKSSQQNDEKGKRTNDRAHSAESQQKRKPHTSATAAGHEKNKTSRREPEKEVHGSEDYSKYFDNSSDEEKEDGEVDEESVETTAKGNKEQFDFALVPAAFNKGILNYGLKSHASIFKRAVTPAYDDFDAHPGQLQAYLTALSNHAYANGWLDEESFSGLLNIPKQPGRGIHLSRSTTWNYLESYGEIPKIRLIAYIYSYHGHQMRKAQDDQMLVQYIVASLSNQGSNKLFIRKEDFTLNGRRSGLLMLKTLIDTSKLQTNASIIKLKEELTNLVQLIKDYNFNIDKFNEKVLLIVEKLNQHGKDAPDLGFQVLTAYETCPNDQFKRYIQRVRDDYEDGHTDMRPKQLMERALNKYKTLTDSGKWNTEDADKESLLALESQIKNLKRQMKKQKKGGRKKRSAPESDTETRIPRKKGWQLKKPGKNDPKTKEVNGRTYHWCSTDNGAKHPGGCDKWVMHDPADCEGPDYKRKSKTKKGARKNDRSSKREKNGGGRKAKVMKVQEATICRSDESDESCESSDSDME